ncbi:hypothetical protein [Fuscovulum blasticum]|uniref:hypothetical protein n=1 Tax=Fuscovulum blasticum TaxID=1075 RepID=UPI000D3E04AF|nr:hypothetical protein [Fuscovulum blasticum]AWD22775.1 hypothetical protein B6K69_14720 [Fuscovulum blasticum]
MTRPAYSFEFETSTPAPTVQAHEWLAVQALKAVAARRKIQAAANTDTPCTRQADVQPGSAGRDTSRRP